MSKYEPEFDNAVNFTLRQEGVLSDHPSDKGGLTKYGITAATWATYRKIAGMGVPGPASVAQITVDQAVDCYHLIFWQEPGIASLPRELQGPAFDYAVNSGPDRAIKAIQAAVGADVDGDLGPQTLGKIAGLPVATLRKVRNDAVTSRLVFLADVTQHDKSQIDFIEGWVRRVTKLYDFAY